VACAGGGAGPLWEAETAALGIAPGDRRKRMVENIHVLRHLWSRDNEPFTGQFTSFSNVTLEPKPVQSPCPIWLATNADRLSKGQADSGGSELALTRVGNILYHHINVNEDRDDALADSKKFLDLYYSADYSKERIESWLTYGSPRDCIEQIRRFKASGCRRITFRISTMRDPMVQFRRLVEEVLPHVG
jgi:alkanesulfonate monooxygenase SsuD/methylene tetrahydromethanopterin reductase-like flavin-dependent oxidoreductase (luciferase family)